jgi:hypothetical protein
MKNNQSGETEAKGKAVLQIILVSSLRPEKVNWFAFLSLAYFLQILNHGDSSFFSCFRNVRKKSN